MAKAAIPVITMKILNRVVIHPVGYLGSFRPETK